VSYLGSQRNNLLSLYLPQRQGTWKPHQQLIMPYGYYDYLVILTVNGRSQLLSYATIVPPLLSPKTMCFTATTTTLTLTITSFMSLFAMATLIYIFFGTEGQLADIFTWSLACQNFEFQGQHLSITCVATCNS